MSEEKKPKSKKPPFEPFKVRVTSKNLNMRTKPSFEGEIVGHITDQGKYTVTKYSTGKNAAFGWGYLSETKAWVSLDYCKRI